MSKTPIMILQELGIKECVVPCYDIIYSQSGTHISTFTFRVKYNNLSANGTASNKKEAKQNAAQNMLKLLQQSSNISSTGLRMLSSYESNIITTKSLSPTSSPSDSSNYIGILQEYCVQNRLIEPYYEVVKIDGPPHEIEFTMSCTLGSITEKAVANTKKQAKQQVAYKVLQNLPNIKKCINNKEPLSNSRPHKEDTEKILKDLGLQIANLKIIDSKPLEHVKLKFLNANRQAMLQSLLNLNENICVTTYHLYFKSMIYNRVCNSKEDELSALYNILTINVEKCRSSETHDENNLLVHKQALTYIKEKFNLSIDRISLSNKTSEKIIIGFRVNLLVPFIQFGMNKDTIVAEKEAITKTIETIMLYLK